MAVFNPGLGDGPQSQREAHPVVEFVREGRRVERPPVVCSACGAVLGVVGRDASAALARACVAHRCPP
jgi:hypothetical protein